APSTFRRPSMPFLDTSRLRAHGRLSMKRFLLFVSVTVLAAQHVSAAGPCDIYASGGTACVAAHSTVRALFGSYGGRLYQVKRASDGATIDVGTLSAGGYANASTHDQFRAGTTRTITVIYDQTTRNNHLT